MHDPMFCASRWGGLERVINLPRSAGSMGRVWPDRFKISQLTAGPSWAAYRARSSANPARSTPAARINEAAETRVS